MSTGILESWRNLKWVWFTETEASQIVELAVALPLLAVVVIGITDFGGAFNTKFKLSNASREGARFAANQSTTDLSITPPPSILAVRDVVDSYLVGANMKDCGLAAASPSKTPGFLIWTYTANTGCPGTLTLTVDRGSTFVTAAATPVTTEATHINVQYPYQWRFNRVIRLLVPSATYAGLTLLSGDAVMQNLD